MLPDTLRLLPRDRIAAVDHDDVQGRGPRPGAVIGIQWRFALAQPPRAPTHRYDQDYSDHRKNNTENLIVSMSLRVSPTHHRVISSLLGADRCSSIFRIR